MNILKDLLNIVTQNNFLVLPNKKLILFIYLFIFIILFLENAVLPAFFLPGDSLLIIVGILIEKGILNLFVTLGLLTIAVSLGSWISYLQGRFFRDKKFLKHWLSRIPYRSYQKVYDMFNKHGLCVLFIGRFIVFVRTALPTIAGVSGLNYLKFQLFNWISSFVWVLILISVGFYLSHIKIFLCSI